MKKLLLFVACVLCTTIMSAQEQKMKQKVQLKNGTEIIGYVAPQSDGSYVVQNKDGDIFYYTSAEIKKIVEMEEVKVKTVKVKDTPATKVNATPAEHSLKTKGYMGMVNGLLGTDVGVTMVNGYRFSQHFYLGFETGIAFDGLEDGEIGIPLGLYMMSEFSKKRVSMFADFRAGAHYNMYQGVALPYGIISLGVRARTRKNPNRAMWYGLFFGFREYEYFYSDYHYDSYFDYSSGEYYYDSYYTTEYDSYINPNIGFKIAFSF